MVVERIVNAASLGFIPSATAHSNNRKFSLIKPAGSRNSGQLHILLHSAGLFPSATWELLLNSSDYHLQSPGTHLFQDTSALLPGAGAYRQSCLFRAFSCFFRNRCFRKCHLCADDDLVDSARCLCFIYGGNNDHAVLDTGIHMCPERSDLFRSDPIRRKFICVKNPPDAAFFGIVGHFAAETTVRLYRPTYKAGKAFETHGIDMFRFFQDGGIGFFEEPGNILCTCVD